MAPPASGKVGQRKYRLRRTVAGRCHADDGRALMILQRATDDFRDRSRAGIDQHHQRLAA
jgi:hypothetical protein